jgi:hypothetical protein
VLLLFVVVCVSNHQNNKQHNIYNEQPVFVGVFINKKSCSQNVVNFVFHEVVDGLWLLVNGWWLMVAG